MIFVLTNLLCLFIGFVAGIVYTVKSEQMVQKLYCIKHDVVFAVKKAIEEQMTKGKGE